jgi:hypothetical protein
MSTVLFSGLDNGVWPFFALLGLSAAGFVLSLQADLFSREFHDDEHRQRVQAGGARSRLRRT